jgi:hypothetical protein
LGLVLTFLFVNMAWVFFRAPDVHSALVIIGSMADSSLTGADVMLACTPLLALSATVVWLLPNSQDIVRAVAGKRPALSWALCGAAMFVAFFATNSSIPSAFIYYNF